MVLLVQNAENQARSQGGGNRPPIPKVEPAIFRLIKLWCASQSNTSVQINETAQRTFPTSAFRRTWSKQYGLLIVHD